MGKDVAVALGYGRAPHGARGLKYKAEERALDQEIVAPRTGRVD